MNMTLSDMIDEYGLWREHHDRDDLGSADEHLHDESLSDDQRSWLGRFVKRWEKAERGYEDEEGNFWGFAYNGRGERVRVCVPGENTDFDDTRDAA
jgi:YD repeat-containing protein